jgi:hypothetical protein
MDFLEKPPVKISWRNLKCIAVPILLIICLLFTVGSVGNVARYEQVRTKPLILDVPVTHVDVDYDVENGDDYHAMVSYTYGGKNYTEKYRTFSTEKKAQALVGKTVTIYVDPQSPGDQLSDIKSGGIAQLVGGCGFLVLAILCLRISHRKSYAEVYGWRREAIKKDMLHKTRYSSAEEWLAPAILFLGVAFTHPAAYLDSPFFVLAALVIAIVGVIKLIRKMARIRKVKSDAFVIRRDTFVCKEHIPDDDGPDLYKVTYENENGSWTKTVSLKVYMKASPGDVIDCAYLEGERNPILSHTSSGEYF